MIEYGRTAFRCPAVLLDIEPWNKQPCPDPGFPLGRERFILQDQTAASW